MRRIDRVALGVAPLLAVLAGACSEAAPVLGGDDLLPVEATTVEWILPFEEFGSGVEVVGGFGRVSEVGTGLVALNDGFESRSLLRFNSYPRSVSVPDSLGVTRTDTLLSVIGAELVLRFDSVGVQPSDAAAIPVRVLRMEAGRWDPVSASWQLAVDSLNDSRAWPQPGAGSASFVASGEWEPGQGDSLLIRIDSATVAAWGDTTDAGRGTRLDAVTQGTRISLRSAILRLEVRPSVNPDTTVALAVGTIGNTFVYDPLPDPPSGELRVGGAPAWRTFFRIDLPERIEAPDPVCQRVQCPVELTPESVVYAALILRSRVAQPAFQPVDSLSVDVRPVLDPDRIPRAPLGTSFLPFGQPVAPEWFGSEPGRSVAVPVTGFIRDLVRGETESGLPPAGALALMAPLEPLDFGFTPFAGPGTDGAPSLRILITLLDGVRLP